MMDDQPNLRELLDEVSSFVGEVPRGTPARSPSCELHVDRRSASRSPARARASAWTPPSLEALPVALGPVGRDVGPGRQPGQDGGRQQLADRQRPHPAAATTDGELIANVDFLGEGAKRFDRPPQQFPPRRDPLSDPGRRGARGRDRRSARHLRRQRRAAYRDRHRLSDRRHPRRALRRSDAVEAFRDPGIDRYR